ncbi:MAG: acyltransferase [Ferruginibacter sp.]|nr:acyltransferase [Ferruginibacter sp.]
MLQGNRQTWIDYARGVAIILVLYRHVFEGIKAAGLDVQAYMPLEHANILFFSFRMPLFFVVSGIFVAGSLQKRGLSPFIGNKARTILYPYFIWGFLQITLQIILSGYVNAQRTPADYGLLFYLPRGVEQFWYLYALFNVSVCYALMKVKAGLNFWQNAGLGLGLYYASAVIGQHQINIGFLADIMHYYIFYAIGDGIGRFIRDKENLSVLQSWKLMALLIIPFAVTQWYFLLENLHHETKFYDYVEYHQPIRFLIIALTGCAWVMSLAFQLQRYHTMQWLHQLGRHSLYIYVAHVMVLAATRIIMVRFFGIEHVPTLLLAGISMGLIVPVLLYKLSVRYKFTWLFSLEKKETIAPAEQQKYLKG